jgi:hypothetical protein
MDDLWQRGYMQATESDLPRFYARVAETVAWCIKHADTNDPCGSLRSPMLHPPLFHAGREDAIYEVGTTRGSRLRAQKLNDTYTTLPDLAGGRLLAYFPDEEMRDGAAEASSGGFFDGYNTPPWDTWVAYFEDRNLGALRFERNYLVAFVPSALINDAQLGIDDDPMESIAWLSNTKTRLAELLKRTGAIY